MERIVLADAVSHDDIDDARVKHGWRLADVVAARTGVPSQQILLTSDRRHVLHFVDDARLDLRYVVVSGPDVAATRHTIEESLPIVDGEALSAIGDALDDLARAEPVLAEIVDLKFFCGFSFAEIGAMHGNAERTIKRKWEKARLYLHRSLRTTSSS